MQGYGYFMQGGATPHTGNYSIAFLHEVFEGRMVSHRLQPARSPGLNPHDSYL